ncbi:MAG: hypothetical protein ACYSUB_22950, partial [Planctomycetota bacterium]
MYSQIRNISIACIILIALGCVFQTAAAEAPYVLVQGSQLHGANGVFFDSDDRLYIACAFGQEIAVMDKETGEILDRLGPDVG